MTNLIETRSEAKSNASSKSMSKPISMTRRALMGSAGAFGIMLSGSAAHQFWLGLTTKRVALPAEPSIEIPVFDARRVGVIGHAEARRDAMDTLRNACLGPLTPLATPLVAFLDLRARNWLAAASPARIAELDAIAKTSKQPGVYLLNASYEFGCTALAAPAADGTTPRLLRTLDWPFNGLGQHVEIVRMQGEAGEFLNVTWPGAVGVLTALAPKRFAASINQAPFERYTEADWLQPVDFVRTTLNTWRHVKDEPAMHLLRRVFESANDYSEAKTMLTKARIARPAIFTLVGTKPGEHCVIERNVDSAHVQEGIATAANDWRYGKFEGRWMGHGGDSKDARGDSGERNSMIETFAAKPTADFAWVQAPILNAFTRLAIEMEPASGHLRVRGYEESEDGETAVPATRAHDQHWA